MPQRYVPKILVVSGLGIDLRRAPYIPADFFEREDWLCGDPRCQREATKIIARPLSGQREFFGLCCADHFTHYEEQLQEALEAESQQAAEFDADMQRVN